MYVLINTIIPVGGIIVKFSQGTTFKQIKVEVTESDKVSDIKERIRKQEGIPVYYRLLKFNKEPLEPDRVLMSYYNIEDMSTLDLEG